MSDLASLRATVRKVPWALLVLMAGLWGASQWAQSRHQAQQAQAILKAQPQGRITLYTSASCFYCERAKAWLDEAGIPYKDCAIDMPGPCAEAYAQMGQPGTPVVAVDGRLHHLGFDAPWLAQALQHPSAAASPNR